MCESKKDIYDIMPQQFYPPTLFFKTGTTQDEIKTALQEQALQFPLIGKPDIGGRGRGVKKLENINDVFAYAQNSTVDFLLQEFVAFENEVGIFYYRFPNEANGKISGIVSKEFLTVTGNGVSTVEQLLKNDKRFLLQLPSLQKEYKLSLQSILADGENFLMVPYGNHARGAKFIDASNLIDEQLTKAIDEVCKQVPGFYFGRLDVRYNTWQQLREGKNFSIIEMNGAGSEPTHIYDPKHSIFFAWKEIIRHWNILFKISRQNHKLQDIPYMKFSSGIQMFRENSAYSKAMDAMENNAA